MDRRTLLHSALAGFLGGPPRRPRAPRPPPRPPAPSASTPWSRAPARPPPRPTARPLMKMTEPFADLKYDQFRAIRFRDEQRLFTDADRGFQMDLMPPGFYYQDRIEVNLVANGVAEPIPFSTDFFAFHPDYFPYPDGRAPAGLAADMGFSGIRFRHPINRPGRLGRGRGVPGRELLPRRRPRHPLRPLRARPRHRHRRPGRRGVPDLHRLLGPRAAARRPRPAPQRAPRQRLGRRRLRLHHRARRRDGDAGPLGALPPPRDHGRSASRR